MVEESPFEPIHAPHPCTLQFSHSPILSDILQHYTFLFTFSFISLQYSVLIINHFQLNQVQGTINILQESLRQEQSHVLGGSRTPHYHSQLGPPLLPDLTPTSLPPVAPPSQALTPMSAYAGLGSLALAAQGKEMLLTVGLLVE